VGGGGDTLGGLEASELAEEARLSGTDEFAAIRAYWGRDGLGAAILEALAAAGKDLAALSVDDLAPFDQFHAGGKAGTERLARLAELQSGTRVLDVGGGLGGPARTLAAQFGCRVTVVDLTESYVRAAEQLTARLGLADRVSHQVGNALELPFEDGSFDLVWTQNSGMNIAAKEQLYAGFRRVLREGGRLAFQEPAAGPTQPPIFPVMWARDASTSFLSPPAELRALVEATGFRLRAWDDVTAESARPGPGGAGGPVATIQSLVMGEQLAEINRAGRRNTEEGRVLLVQAVFDRD
jgi:sarcosine/dimethylglycine N-methyltransferase